jgi:hypothetical protein
MRDPRCISQKQETPLPRFEAWLTGKGQAGLSFGERGATDYECGPGTRARWGVARKRTADRIASSLAFSLIEFLLDRDAVVTFIASMRRHSQVKTPWRLFLVFLLQLFRGSDKFSV